MPKPTLIVGVDFSPLSRMAIDAAITLGKHMKARLHLVHAVYPPILAGPVTPYLAAQEEVGDRLSRAVEKANAELESLQIPTDLQVTREVRAGTPRTELVIAAENERAIAIVVATRGRDRGEGPAVGSVTTALMQRASCPVLIVDAERRLEEISNILAAVDLSSASEWVVRAAAAVGGADAALLAGIVLPPREGVDPDRRRVEQDVRARIDHLMKDVTCVKSTSLLEGRYPADTLAGAAIRAKSDLLVIASSGHGALHRMILGSTTRRIVHRSPCPVLVVPHDA